MADEEGALVLGSRCYELESSVAYHPLRNILQQVQALSPQDRPEHLIGHSLYLKRVLFGSAAGEISSRDPGVFQLELFAEVQRLFEMLAARRPLLLWLDDLHYADDETIRLLHFLARNIASDKVLIVATYRAEEVDRRDRLAELVGSLRRDRLASEIEMLSLSEQAMTLLVEQTFGGQPVEARLLQEVLKQADGNPLFATELVHTFVQEGWARLVDGRWQRRDSGASPVPTAVTDLVNLRLRRLSPTAQEELQVAAVIGRDVDFTVLRQALQLSDRRALDALDECIEAFIIEETDRAYRFRHELLRHAIYAGMRRGRRQLLHKAVGAALEASSAEPGEVAESVAYHYGLCDEPWRALPHLKESARRAAAVFANDQAVALYERALELMRAHPAALAAGEQAELFESLGDLERRLGNTSRSVDLFEEAYAHFDSAGRGEDAVRVRGKAALGHIILGRADSAQELIGTTLRQLTDQSPQGVVSRTYYLLAQLHWHSGQNRAALEAAEKALLAANAGGDSGQRAQAYEVLALACHSLGDWQRGVELELERQGLGLPGFDTDEAFEAHL
jgi:tetratricopeptide (TPR) repeat protein